MAKKNYTAIIDQDNVTQEVKDIAVKYDPLNRSGGEGFHVNQDGELKIEEEKVMKSHRIIQDKIDNDSIRIVELPSESGQLMHQYGRNEFRIYNLPKPVEGDVIGLLGKNGIGKTTALEILSGELLPNLGMHEDPPNLQDVVGSLSESVLVEHLRKAQDDNISVSRKPQIASDYTMDKVVSDVLNISSDDDMAKNLSIDGLLNKRLSSLSGGELQRVLICNALNVEADVYIFDEPSSFLDVGQRVDTSEVISNNVEEDSTTFVVDHDLTFLESLCDKVHILYGETNNYGVVSNPSSTRNGINDYVKGYVSGDDVKIRSEQFKFEIRSSEDKQLEDNRISYPDFDVTLGDFDLSVSGGDIMESQVVGILGENGLGKTTYAKALAGQFDTIEDFDFRVSYKPQYLEATNENISPDTYVSQISNIDRSTMKDMNRRLNIDNLMNQKLGNMSGGELQKLSVSICLSRQADVYLLDEPSAYLDVETRNKMAQLLKTHSNKTSDPILVIDHDIFFISTVSDDVVVFSGVPGDHGEATPVIDLKEGMNTFLSEMDITLRKDRDTKRPKFNSKGSQLDRKQRKSGEFYK